MKNCCMPESNAYELSFVMCASQAWECREEVMSVCIIVKSQTVTVDHPAVIPPARGEQRHIPTASE